MTTQQDRFNTFDKLNSEIGVFINGYRPTVNTGAGGFEIRSSLRRIKSVLFSLLFFSCFALLGLIMLILPDSLVDAEARKTAFLAFAMNMFLVAAVLTPMISVCRMCYDPAKGMLDISCRRIFKKVKVQMPWQNLAFRIYRQKSGHKLLKIKHGDYVFAFYDKYDEQRGECVIAAFKKEEDALMIYNELKNFFAVDIDNEIISPKPKLNVKAGNQWEVMSYETNRKPVFAIASSFDITGVYVSKDKQKTHIKCSRQKWIPAILLLGLGIPIAWLAVSQVAGYYNSPEFPKLSNIILSVLIGAMASFLIGYGLLMIFRTNQVTLNAADKMIIIKYVKGLFWKKVTFNRNQTVYKKYIVDKCRSSGGLEPGNIVLALHNPNFNTEVIIASSDREDMIKDANNAFIEFYGQQECAADDCFQTLELSDGRVIRFARTRIKDDAEFSKRRFKIINDNLATFVIPESQLVMFVLGIIIGAVMMASVWWGLGGEMNLKESILVQAVGLFMFIGACYFVFSLFKMRNICFDKKENSIYMAPFTSKGNRKSKGLVTEIAALQVCCVTTIWHSGQKNSQQTVYQLNAIMDRGKDDDREMIMCDINPAKLYKTAKEFSEFLGVPVVDSDS